MHDKKLITLIEEKNEECISLIADKYEKLLYHIAYGILGGRAEDIEECINDTYLKFWNNIDKYDLEKASVKTYLKVILRNTAINRLRDIGRKEENMSYEDLTDIAATYADESQNVENKLINREKVILLNEIIGEMPKKDKEISIRRFFYLQSSKEIARAMMMTVSAVDCKVSRIKSKIKIKFEENGYE